MRRAIPPLNPLHVFEVSARLGSFTKAAEELNVTQSAVSRQVATLEDYLKVRLFRRERFGITLTEAGESYRREIEPAFAAIASVTGKLLLNGHSQPLYLRVYPTFAVKWLIPKLSSFHADNPQIEIRVSSGAAPVDFARENIDFSIQVLHDDQAEPHYMRLFPDLIQPVCSPTLLNGKNPIRSVKDLAQHRLLYSHYRRNDWRDWLSGTGHPGIHFDGIEFHSSLLTYQAAVEGLGVAIGQIRLLQEDIRTGALVPLFHRPIERSMSYYLIWPNKKEPNDKGRAFLCWLGKTIGNQLI